jgi:radical SAM superfamily enzyme YgiQ (UPF0313 family)
VLTPETIQMHLERLLPTVQKPGRYTGGELNQVVKEWDSVQTKIALVFPDIYDIGISNLGLATLYDLLNQPSDASAGRAYSPWSDMEAALRSAHLPLYSLESKHPLGIAGEHAAYKPELMHAFIDAFVIGEGEEVIHEIVDTHQAWRQSGLENRYVAVVGTTLV